MAGVIGRDGSAVDVEPDAWRSGMDLLVGAQFLGAKYGIPAMEESGTHRIRSRFRSGKVRDGDTWQGAEDGGWSDREYLFGAWFVAGAAGIGIRGW